VIILVQDLQPVVDSSYRTDDVMADLARNESSELEIGRMRGLSHQGLLNRRLFYSPCAGRRSRGQTGALQIGFRVLIHAPPHRCQDRIAALGRAAHISWGLDSGD